MIWEKDILSPTQPYFVLDMQDFYQEVYLQQGISHFYTFKSREVSMLRTVPDGCMDLFFEYRDGRMKGYVCGTRLQYSCERWEGNQEVFGVRFMPGVQPSILQIRMRDVLDHKMDVTEVLVGDRTWLTELEAETDFYQRIRIFIEAYTKAEKRRTPLYGKRELVLEVKRLVYESDGKIKIAELEQKTGYSQRYIHRVFIEEMGFSPKIFCKIIQFQRTLEFLNYGGPDKMTDAAVFLGYYDQAQFIRDFSKYAGMTPRQC